MRNENLGETELFIPDCVHTYIEMDMHRYTAVHRRQKLAAERSSSWQANVVADRLYCSCRGHLHTTQGVTGIAMTWEPGHHNVSFLLIHQKLLTKWKA